MDSDSLWWCKFIVGRPVSWIVACIQKVSHDSVSVILRVWWIGGSSIELMIPIGPALPKDWLVCICRVDCFPLGVPRTRSARTYPRSPSVRKLGVDPASRRANRLHSFTRKMAENVDGGVLLKRERAAATFAVADLTLLLYGGFVCSAFMCNCTKTKGHLAR